MEELYVYLDQFFEWNGAKAVQNAAKHGVRFTEAASVFFDEAALFKNDPDHSEDEEHYILLGRSFRLDILLVVHVIRGERVRILSARAATPSERRQYEDRRRG